VKQILWRTARRPALVLALALTALVAVLFFAAPVLAQVPNPGPQAPPGLEKPATTLIAWLKWGGMFAGVAGLIGCGLQMMVGRRNRSNMAVDGAAGIPWVFSGMVLIGFGSSLISAIMN